MAEQPFSLRPGHSLGPAPCPSCGNQSSFVGKSERVAEDCCEIWVTCAVCGFDPTDEDADYRIEDVWGDLSPENLAAALIDCWNELLTAQATDRSEP